LNQIGLFEMRRLEMLSNTIFGVAMTLLAYDLPKAGSFKSAPNWIDLANVYAQPVIALMISFIVAGMFWFSHHRRLAVAPEGSRGVVFLNLLFLLSIIILPVTNGLYGSYRLDGVVAVMYGIHLTTIATLNALLWILALRGRRNSELLANAVFPVFALVFATVIAAVTPFVAQFMWCLAENELARSISAKASWYAMANRPCDGSRIAPLGLTSETSPLCEQQRTSAKATEFMGSRPGFSRPYRIVQHVFAEVALLLVRARDRVAALGVAIFSTIDIFGRSGCELAACPAEGVVILRQARAGRRLAAMRAGRKRECHQHQRHRKRQNRKPHAKSRDVGG
jgi:uncharacterized membrane protein